MTSTVCDTVDIRTNATIRFPGALGVEKLCDSDETPLPSVLADCTRLIDGVEEELVCGIGELAEKLAIEANSALRTQKRTLHPILPTLFACVDQPELACVYAPDLPTQEWEEFKRVS